MKRACRAIMKKGFGEKWEEESKKLSNRGKQVVRQLDVNAKESWNKTSIRLAKTKSREIFPLCTGGGKDVVMF